MDNRQNIAEIIVDLPVKTDNVSYQYLIPDNLLNTITVGATVIVPFTNRQMIGYVIRLSVPDTQRKLKEIIAIIDEPPIISTNTLPLFKWMSDYYLAPLNETIKLGLPPGRIRRLKEIYSIATDVNIQNQPEYRQLMATLGPTRAGLAKKDLLKIVSDKELNKLTSAGYLCKNYLLIEPKVKKKLVKIVSLSKKSDLNFNQVTGVKQKIILDYLSNKNQRRAEASLLLRDCHTSSTTLNRLRDKGMVAFDYQEKIREPDSSPIAGPTDIKKPTPAQYKAIEAIKQVVSQGTHAIFLLEGVTGSGKTEVYIQAIKQVIKRGRSAIVLVPEIALTPQLTDRFRERFNNLVAVLHSGLSMGERFDQWQRLYRGEARIAIGPRSALFAPVNNVGLIVIDEEHETSFKQNRGPRYNARDVAVKLAALNKAVLVLGTATPSLETKFKAISGNINYLSLPERVLDKSMPKVEIVDMRLEAEKDNYTIFSERLRATMAKCVDNGQKMIIFLNRRGYSSFLLCRKCGYVAQCKNCAISLTFHYKEKQLQCHHCGYSRPAASYCPNCGSVKLKYSGTGTEKVESELKKIFPDVPLVRMDADTTTAKGAHRRHLAEFAAQSPAILLGTQMIAKGLDFPEVSLVGVINADVSLNLPDFRAGERTFQLLMQVSGRSGRGEYPGKVIIQTYLPDHYAIKSVLSGDMEQFYRREIEFRRGSGYPPFTRMINIVISGPDKVKVKREAEKIYSFLNETINSNEAAIYGPGPAPIPKLKQSWRWHLFLTTRDPIRVKKLISDNWARVFSGNKQSKIIVDVDPSWIL